MSDRGHAAVEMALAVGLLLLPSALAVLSFGPWSESRVAAEAMASEGARAAVIALDTSAGSAAIAAQGRNLGHDEGFRVGWCGAPPTQAEAGSCPLTRGGVVTVTVEVWVPLIATPWGGIGGLWVSADHSEPIDLYRSLG